MNTKGKKVDRRQLDRKQAIYKVLNDKCGVRKAISPEEAIEYFLAIKFNKQSMFGVVKLSKLNLDEYYDLNEGFKYYTRRATLLQYALYRDNDSIAAALVRSGASPLLPIDEGLRGVHTNELTSNSNYQDILIKRRDIIKRIKALRSNIRTDFFLWMLKSICLLRKFYALKCNGAVTDIETVAETDRCASASSGHECCICTHPTSSASFDVETNLLLTNANPLLVWPCCKQVYCLTCYWCHLLDQLTRYRCMIPDVECPHCHCLFSKLECIKNDTKYSKFLSRVAALVDASSGNGDSGLTNTSTVDKVSESMKYDEFHIGSTMSDCSSYITSLLELIPPSMNEIPYTVSSQDEVFLQCCNRSRATQSKYEHFLGLQRELKTGALTHVGVKKKKANGLGRAVLTATPRFVSCTQRMGIFPSQRLAAWFHAVCNGDYCRVYSLLESGVNFRRDSEDEAAADHEGWVDEYGHDALFWAVLNRRFEVFVVLMYYGDVHFDRCDHMNCDVIEVIWGSLLGFGVSAISVSLINSVIQDVCIVLSILKRFLPVKSYLNFIARHNVHLREKCLLFNENAAKQHSGTGVESTSKHKSLSATLCRIRVDDVEPYKVNQPLVSMTVNQADKSPIDRFSLVDQCSDSDNGGGCDGQSSDDKLFADAQYIYVMTFTIQSRFSSRPLVPSLPMGAAVENSMLSGVFHSQTQDILRFDCVDGSGAACNAFGEACTTHKILMKCTRSGEKDGVVGDAEDLVGDAEDDVELDRRNDNSMLEFAFSAMEVSEGENSNKKLNSVEFEYIGGDERYTSCNYIDKVNHNNHTLMKNLLIAEEALSSSAVPPHPAVGSFVIDNLFSVSFINHLHMLYDTVPIMPASKVSCSDRSYIHDSMGCLRMHIALALTDVCCQCGGIVYQDTSPVVECPSTRRMDACDCPNRFDPNRARFHAHSRMRYLKYNVDGGDLAPHTDLSKTSYYSLPDAQYTSTHTFILYLRTTRDCSGETVIMNSLNNAAPGDEEPYSGHNKRILASISPVFNRLFVFPHISPHAAVPVHDTPKMLIRGELYMR